MAFAALAPLLAELLAAGGAGGAGSAAATATAAGTAARAGAAASAAEGGTAASAAARGGRALQSADLVTSLLSSMLGSRGRPAPPQPSSGPPPYPDPRDVPRAPPRGGGDAQGGGGGGGGQQPPQTPSGTPDPPPPSGGNPLAQFGHGAIFGGSGAAALGVMRYTPIPNRYHWRDELAGPGEQRFGQDVWRMGKRQITAAINPMAALRGEGLKNVIELPLAIRRWGEELVESRRHLMRYNGTLAAAYMEMERRNIVRSFRSGARVSESTADLARSVSELRDTVQPYRDVITNGTNRIVTTLSELLAATVKTTEEQIVYWAPLYGMAMRWLERQEKQAPRDELPPFAAFMEQLAGKPNGRINQGVRRRP